MGRSVFFKIMKKKKPSVKRTRRSPYERSLEHATKRLEKAQAELIYHQACVQELNQEIPYLQTVIRALTPSGNVHYPTNQAWSDDRRATISGAIVKQEVDQAAFLARYIKPVEIHVPENPEGEDAFLDVRIPGEKAVLD